MRPIRNKCLRRAALRAHVQVTHADLEAAVRAVGEFGADNRAGIPGTLHRISCIRNRKGLVVGLTCRVGRAVTGHTDMIRDLVESECGDFSGVCVRGGPATHGPQWMSQEPRITR